MKVLTQLLLLFFLVLSIQAICQEITSKGNDDYFKQFSALTQLNNKEIDIKYSVTDSMEFLISLDLNFLFSKKALALMTKTIKEDTSLLNFHSGYNQEKKATLCFEKLHFKYNKDRNSFITDSIINISAINGNKIEKTIYGYIELMPVNTETMLFIYLQNSNYFFFFKYNNGLMQTKSSINEYDNIIYKTPVRKRNFKRKGYGYYLSSERTAKEFIHSVNP